MKIKDYLLEESDMVVGKKVWNPECGDGAVISIDAKNKYPIMCEFNGILLSFLKDCRGNELDTHSSLYSTNILELEVKDTNLPRVVEVRDVEYEIWNRRVLYNINEDFTHPFGVYADCEDLSSIEKGKMSKCSYRFMREIEQPKISQENLQLAQKIINEAQNICNEMKKLNEILSNNIN